MNALISPDPLRREFFGHERLVSTLYRAVKPDPAALEFAGRVGLPGRHRRRHPRQAEPGPAGHLARSWGRSRELLDESITGVDMPRKPAAGASTSPRSTSRRWRRRFKKSKHRNTDLEVLKAAIRAQLEKLIRLEPDPRRFRARSSRS